LRKTLDEPTKVDYSRFWANRAGQTVAEIAQREGIDEGEVALSLLKIRNDNERYSAMSVGVEVRRLLLKALPQIQSSIEEALTATRFVGKKVVVIDQEGNTETTEESVEQPDHETRLMAIDGMRTLLSVVQPRDPAVVVTNNSQTNVLNQAPQPGEMMGLTSPEAVIRSIQAHRASLALTDGKPEIVDAEPIEDAEEDSDEDSEEEEDAE
jgi:hypothetical protein